MHTLADVLYLVVAHSQLHTMMHYYLEIQTIVQTFACSEFRKCPQIASTVPPDQEVAVYSREIHAFTYKTIIHNNNIFPSFLKVGG